MTFLQALWISIKILIVVSLLIGIGIGGMHLMYTLLGSVGRFVCFVFLIILTIAVVVYEEAN